MLEAFPYNLAVRTRARARRARLKYDDALLTVSPTPALSNRVWVPYEKAVLLNNVAPGTLES